MNSSKFDIDKLNTYLNANEISELKYLNEQAEKANESIKDKTDIMNLSLNELINNWANVNSKVFSDIVIFISNIGKYREYIEDDDSNSFLYALQNLLSDFMKIFHQEGRLLYIGMTLILISVLIYFIGITS
tara:strand:- start:240 stop:632 length:393 start_codon:yes stop_codon:yes gene_type:complete